MRQLHHSKITVRRARVCAAALAAGLMFGGHVQAQEAQAVDAEAEQDGESSETIIVTGSRLQSGFNAPTPVTVATATELDLAAPNNIADGLNQLPAFNNSLKSQNPGTAAAAGNSGQNLLNLRGLDPNRTLILLNGNRMVASNFLGSVDVNILPQALVQRVEVVTGGASAAYGSDAVAGVVNFILDEDMEGLKGEVTGGISDYGDMESFNASLAYGASLADDRLHILVSGEYFHQEGIRADETTGREWFDVAAGQYAIPGASTAVTVVPDIRASNGANGGMIPTGVLRGTTFLPGNQLGTFNFGTNTSASFQSGGDGPRINIGFAPSQERYNGFLRTQYEASDSLTIYAEGLYAHSHTNQGAFVNNHVGAGNQFTVFRDNAFLPPALATLMDARNLTSVPVGRYSPDWPLVEIESFTDVMRGALGVRGDLSDRWSWDSAVSYGRTEQDLYENNMTINRAVYAAVDAVRDPADSTKIVCRSTLAGLDAGCVPLNIFGLGAASDAALDYVLADGVKFLTLEQVVANANISGDLGDAFSFGAGPISIAAGVEYRSESAVQTTDALSPITTFTTGIRGAPASQNNRPGGLKFYNPLPFSGEYSVKEGYLEVGVPVLEDSLFGVALNLSGAVRYADYSLSGGVTTWKIGGEYEPIDGIRLRYTRSRDIRGASILELFNSASQSSNTQLYRGVNTPNLTIISGNPDLLPERADTTTFGVVVRPQFLPGLQLSADRYLIDIQDAIGALSAQQTIDGCAAGVQFLCDQLTYNASAGTLVTRTPTLNLAQQRVSGWDFEGLYSTSVGNGTLTLRALATHRTAAFRQLSNAAPISTLGEPDTPKWSGNFSVRYVADKWSLFVQERLISASLFDATKLEGRDTNLNTAPAVWYTTIGATYNLDLAGGEQELFVNVSNVFNRDPPIATRNPTSFSSPTNSAYDTIGRYLTMGIRFNF